MRMQAHHLVERLDGLGSELYSMEMDIDVFNFHLGKKGEHLRLSDELEELWDTVRGWMHVSRFSILSAKGVHHPFCRPPLDQKISLTKWITDLISKSREQSGQSYKLLGQSQSNLIPPSDLQGVLIWCRCSQFISEDLQFDAYFYWRSLFAAWDAWREVTKADLEMIEWAVDSDLVHFITKWKGPFRSIDVPEKGTKDSLWTVALQRGERAYSSEVSVVHLLNVQLQAREGGNRLVPIEVQNGWLTKVLEIPRADTVSSQPPSPLPVAEGVLEQLGRRLADRALPAYVEVSERLETVLSAEINRIEPHLRGEEALYKEIPGKLRDMVDKLRTNREVLNV
jgi:hypothetical protein